MYIFDISFTRKIIPNEINISKIKIPFSIMLECLFETVTNAGININNIDITNMRMAINL